MKNLFPLALPLILGADLIHPIVGQAQLESSAVIAQAQDNSFWQFNAQTNQLQLMLPAGVAPRHFLLARPMRLVIDFPHSGTIAPQDFTYAGAVERLTLSSQVEGQVRLILYLRAGVELQPKQVALQQIDSQRWLITPLIVEPDSPSILNETPTINTPVSPNNAPNSPTERPPIASPLDSLENRAAALTVPSATPTVDETPAIP
ncbi:MAG: AMIN domain-containing protein, partial [Prochlorotrichaceae cyanobacterium]